MLTETLPCFEILLENLRKDIWELLTDQTTSTVYLSHHVLTLKESWQLNQQNFLSNMVGITFIYLFLGISIYLQLQKLNIA